MPFPRLRQLVLLVPDLEPALAETRAAFGFGAGVREEEGMAALGFAHEVLSFADTFLEVCAPLAEDSPASRLVARRGPLGYMVVVQVDDLDAVVARAAEIDVAPLLVEPYAGTRISQWHPPRPRHARRIDEVTPAEAWHFGPELIANATTHVAADMVAAEVGEVVRLLGVDFRFVDQGEERRWPRS